LNTGHHPIIRLKKYLIKAKLWTEENDKKLIEDAKK